MVREGTRKDGLQKIREWMSHVVKSEWDKLNVKRYLNYLIREMVSGIMEGEMVTGFLKRAPQGGSNRCVIGGTWDPGDLGKIKE